MSEMFRGVRPVAAPPELRERVLAAAREAAVEPAVERGTGWGFGRFDLALAATLLLLVLGHLAVGVGRPWPSSPAMRGESVDAQRLASELGSVVVGALERGWQPPAREQARQRQRLLVEVERL
jgi:hypothetical protein